MSLSMCGECGLDADLMPPAYVDAFYRDRERGEMRLIFRRVE